MGLSRADPGDDPAAGVGLAGHLGGALLDAAFEVLVPGVHGHGLLPLDEAAQVGHDVARVEVGDERAPPSADALRAVHQHQGQHGDVPARQVKLGQG